MTKSTIIIHLKIFTLLIKIVRVLKEDLIKREMTPGAEEACEDKAGRQSERLMDHALVKFR